MRAANAMSISWGEHEASPELVRLVCRIMGDDPGLTVEHLIKVDAHKSCTKAMRVELYALALVNGLKPAVLTWLSSKLEPNVALIIANNPKRIERRRTVLTTV